MVLVLVLVLVFEGVGNSLKKKAILADCKRNYCANCLYNLNAVKYCILFCLGGGGMRKRCVF